MRPLFGKSHGPVSYVARTTAFIWTSILLLIVATLPWSRTGPLTFDESETSIQIIGYLLVAPLFENFLMIIVIEFTKVFELRKGDAITIGVVALIAAITHGKTTNAFGIGAALVFGVMAYSYLAWTELSSVSRYLMTVAQHVLANLPIAVLVALVMWT